MLKRTEIKNNTILKFYHALKLNFTKNVKIIKAEIKQFPKIKYNK